MPEAVSSASGPLTDVLAVGFSRVGYGLCELVLAIWHVLLGGLGRNWFLRSEIRYGLRSSDVSRREARLKDGHQDLHPGECHAGALELRIDVYTALQGRGDRYTLVW